MNETREMEMELKRNDGRFRDFDLILTSRVKHDFPFVFYSHFTL